MAEDTRLYTNEPETEGKQVDVTWRIDEKDQDEGDLFQQSEVSLLELDLMPDIPSTSSVIMTHYIF